MAIKSTLFICKKNLKRGFIIAFGFLLFGCQTGPVMAPQDPVIQMPNKGPESSSQPSGGAQVHVPQFVGERAPKVGVILGPGGAKAIAQIGVLQELEKNKIEIAAVAGLEWGALIGALYAMNGQSHEVDWKVSQLPKFSFSSKNLFSQKMRATDEKEFNAYLQKVFSDVRFEQSKVPFACPYIRGPAGRVSMATKGSARVNLRACWQYPPIFPMSDSMAAPFAVAEAVEFVRSQGAELILFINVLESADKKQFADWDESEWNWLAWSPVLNAIKNARVMGVHEMITIDTSTYKMSDLGQRLRLIQLGKQGTAASIQQIQNKYNF